MAEIKKYLDQTGLEALVAKIKSEDAAVLASAKSYADGLATNYDAAGAAATAESNAKKYADEQVKALADGQVATNKTNIETVMGDYLKAADKTELQGKIDAVDGKADDNAEAIAAINNETTGILAVAKKYTDDQIAPVQGEVDDLEVYVGTIPESATATDIVGYINEKTTGIATDAALGELQDAVDAIEADYLKAADKTELDGKITAEKNRAEGIEAGLRSDIDTVKGDYLKAADKTELEGKITAEENRAKGIEGGLETRLKAVEDDYLKAADKTELQGTINDHKAILDAVKEDVDAFFLDADMTESAKDTLKELQAYIASDETAASQMAASIKQNADAIDAVEGRMDTAEGKITTAEGKITALEGAVATKAEQSDLDTANGKITTAEGKITALEGAVATKAEAQALADAVAALEGVDTGLDNRLKAVEAQLGDGENSVSDLIATAKQEAIDAAAQDAASKDAVVLSEAQKYADAEDAKIESRVDALEDDTHTHSNKELLDTYTQTEANLADAVAKKHSHANATVLDGISAEKVAAWDASEQNAKDYAKTYADGLNSAMTSKVEAVEAKADKNAEDIATKAASADLTKLAERVTKNEGDIAANASAIAAFSPISTDDINALFA